MSYDLQKWVAQTPIKRRPWVRWALLLGSVSTTIAAVATVWDRHAEARDFTALFPWSLPAFIAAAYSSFAREVWAGTTKRANYDELERHHLHRATALAYHIILGLVAALFVWLFVATLRDAPRPSRAVDWSGLFVALCLNAGLMPALVAEFLLPLPPASEDD